MQFSLRDLNLAHCRSYLAATLHAGRALRDNVVVPGANRSKGLTELCSRPWADHTCHAR
ncbi:MAG: hypothetical protein ACJ788_02510 [Ktedonobacteraceae bacterium]